MRGTKITPGQKRVLPQEKMAEVKKNRLIFLFSFMRIRAHLSVAFAALYTAGGIAFICAMAWLLNRDFPPGLLQEFIDLTWPLT